MNIINKIKKWFKNVGAYRMKTDTSSFNHVTYVVEVQGLTSWHIVKTFTDEDTEYARMCAIELLEKLEEAI